MDAQSMRCLINSISRFILLVSCQSMKSVLIQKDFESMAGLMKHLKPLLDLVVDGGIITDEILLRECENLDVAVNEARDFLERWCSKFSKIFTVWQSGLLLSKIRSSSLEMCRILCRLLRASPSPSSVAGVQNCMQEIQFWKASQLSILIEHALRGEMNKWIFSDHLSEVIDLLGLTSNHELLKESIATEKQRMRAQANNLKAEVDQIDRIWDLLSVIREHMLKNGYFDAPDSVPIPSYFRCPLSLELMVDPVIVASGQTFERASVQKWLDHGLTICPQTRQCLSHINVISNYTIKALIANWFEEKNLKYPTSSGITLTLAQSPSNFGSNQDVIHADSFVGSLHDSNSTSRSSEELGDVYTRQKVKNEPSGHGEEETGKFQGKEEIVKVGVENTSLEHSYAHSRTHSVSSAISSNDYVPSVTETVRLSNKLDKVMGQCSSETRTECCSSLPITSLSGGGSYNYSSKSISEISESQTGSYSSRALYFPSSDAGSNESTTSSCVKKLIEDLKSKTVEVQTRAAGELRCLTKNNMENRVIVGNCGAVRPLVSLLYSSSKPTQEHAVTALLNLSINEDNKIRLAEAGVIEPIIHVLRSGNDAAKENSAATLFSLSGLVDQKVKIGRSGAVKALVALLSSGTIRGKKDAAAALFNLSISHENRARIVLAGAVKYLVDLLHLDSGLVDKAVALLANLSTVSEGRSAISRAGGIPLIVEILENGSQRSMENAASILLQLCLNSNKFCSMVLQEGAVPPLVALSQSGTPRAKEKAQQLLSHFRSQREGAIGKKRSPKLLG